MDPQEVKAKKLIDGYVILKQSKEDAVISSIKYVDNKIEKAKSSSTVNKWQSVKEAIKQVNCRP